MHNGKNQWKVYIQIPRKFEYGFLVSDGVNIYMIAKGELVHVIESAKENILKSHDTVVPILEGHRRLGAVFF